MTVFQVHTPAAEADDPPPLLRMIDRIAALLECLGAASQPSTLSEIGRQVGIPLSTAHRLLGALVSRGVVERHGRSYLLGQRLRWMADPLCQLSQLHLARYMAATGRPVALAVLQNGRVHYPQVLFPAGHPAAASFHTDALASRTAAGKLLLAYRHRDIDVVPSLQPHPRPAVTGSGHPGREVRRIRHEGVAFASEEHVPGVLEVAAAVRDANGLVVAAVSTAGELGDIHPPTVARDIRRVADDISASRSG